MTFPFRNLLPLTLVDRLPEAADLVIVGAGIIGISTAIFARRAGLRVVVLEKGRVGAEQSGRNWGWIRQQGRDLGELPIVMEALRHWEDFDAQIGGDRLGLRWTGIVKPARTQAQLDSFEVWLQQARAFGVDSRLLSAAQMRGELAGASVPYVGGLMTPSDGRAEPWQAVLALAELANAEGVVIREGCAVRELIVTAGRVTGVESEAGAVAAPHVLVAGGAWSRLLLRAHGVDIPQLSVLASVARTSKVVAPFAGGFSDGAYAWRTRADGGLTIAPNIEHDFMIGPDAFRSFRPYLATLKRDFRSTTFRPFAPKGFPDAWGTARRWQGQSPFEAMRILNPRPNRSALERARRQMVAAFPALSQVRIEEAWGGMIDTMPDVVPVVDHVAALPGVVLATGMAGHGFGIGPGFGRVLADMILGRAVGHELSRFRMARFSDGSPLDFGAAL